MQNSTAGSFVSRKHHSVVQKECEYRERLAQKRLHITKEIFDAIFNCIWRHQISQFISLEQQISSFVYKYAYRRDQLYWHTAALPPKLLMESSSKAEKKKCCSLPLTNINMLTFKWKFQFKSCFLQDVHRGLSSAISSAATQSQKLILRNSRNWGPRKCSTISRVYSWV